MKKIRVLAVILLMVMLCSCGNAGKQAESEKVEDKTSDVNISETEQGTTQKQERTENDKNDTGINADDKETSHNDNKADKLVIKLHYSRSDGKYADWSVWGWEVGTDGTDYKFVEENGEMVATINVDAGTFGFGYIVRTSEWKKDVEKDQFIDCASYKAGTLNVYVKSGVEGCTVQEGADIVRKEDDGGSSANINAALIERVSKYSNTYDVKIKYGGTRGLRHLHLMMEMY